MLKQEFTTFPRALTRCLFAVSKRSGCLFAGGMHILGHRGEALHRSAPPPSGHWSVVLKRNTRTPRDKPQNSDSEPFSLRDPKMVPNIFLNANVRDPTRPQDFFLTRRLLYSQDFGVSKWVSFTRMLCSTTKSKPVDYCWGT